MGDYYFLRVPVKRHIEKFIRSQEGTHIVIRKNCFVWKLIRPYITYKILSGHRYDNVSASYPGSISIRLPKSNIRVYGLQPRISSVGFINNVLNDYFAIELAFFVMHFLKSDGRYRGYNAAIQEFCNLHQIIIDEDITLDALQKLEFRNRKNYKKRVAEKSQYKK